MNDQSTKKQNIALIIGLSIPVAMVLFVAIAINAPNWFSSVEPPQYSFLYTSGKSNPYASYLVKDGRLQRLDIKQSESVTKPAEYQQRFFIHDVSANISSEISENEALELHLDGAVRSPDGFRLKSGNRGGWFLFGYGRDYRTRYLVKENYSQKLELESQDGSYRAYWNIQLLGWVDPNG
ncbi:MAG: hypothetical protein L3J22_06275 [Xanthomonadales bacterium]|nr:hypothetical protein [Xanthomonadales bacterium]